MVLRRKRRIKGKAARAMISPNTNAPALISHGGKLAIKSSMSYTVLRNNFMLSLLSICNALPVGKDGLSKRPKSRPHRSSFIDADPRFAHLGGRARGD